jgi:hypothetical protein
MNLSGTSKIHFGGHAKLFDSGRRQEKATLASAKADFPSLPEVENLLLAAQSNYQNYPIPPWYFKGRGIFFQS